MSARESDGRTPHGNPPPRPALRYEGVEQWVVVARPRPGDQPPQGDDEEAGSADGKGKGKGDKKRDKGEKAGKNNKQQRRRRKAEKKRTKEIVAAAADPANDARRVTVTLPGDFRAALDRAAAEHALSPEALAAFVLVEWLDR